MPPLPKTVLKNGSLAQLVEQLTFNQLVAGSNPARPTIDNVLITLTVISHSQSENRSNPIT